MKRELVLLLVVVTALVLVGVLMVYSASIVRAEVPTADFSERSLLGQLARVILGFLALGLAASFDYHLLRERKILVSVFLLVVILLVAVLVWGEGPSQTRRWFYFGKLSIQPSDFAKPLIIILLAVKLSENQKHIRSFWRGFVPPLVTALFVMFLIALEPDIGTPFVIGCTTVLLIMFAGARWLHLVQSILAGSGFVLLYIFKHPHALERITGWWYTLLDPMKYRSSESFQLIQSLWAFAQGGIWGVGPGGGQQKLYYLFAAESDFIFAVCGEELGLIGTLSIVLLFTLFFCVGLRIAAHAPDFMGSLLAAGVVFLITTQALVSVGVTTGLLPTKGITLPFISAGGTSLVTCLFMVGLLINVGLRSVHEPEVNQLGILGIAQAESK